MRAATDRLYWRMLPVGLATAFLSGVWLSLLFSLLSVKADVGWMEQIGMAAGLGLAGILVAAVLWLPLLVLWNMIVFTLVPRFSLRHLAAVVSGGMVFCLTLAVTVTVLFSGAIEGGRSALFFGGWVVGTTILGSGLTLWSFGPNEEVMA